MAVLEYRIDVRKPAAREALLALELVPADMLAVKDAGLELFLPTWTPGSYLIREFSRHLGRVTAADVESGVPLHCHKTAKNRVRVDISSPERRIRIRWVVYAHELSVRTADVTAEHAYWNHACLLLWPVGGRALPARLAIAFPRAWELACALPAEPEHDAGPDASERRVTLLASDMDHAMDSPCLLGRFQRLQWSVAGIPHAAVLEALGPIEVPTRLTADLGSIVEQAAAVFGGTLPYASYVFLCLFAADGHGGLEHSESTTLLTSRVAFTTEKGYREFLSLASHEVFHAWNVKRLRPEELWHYDYENENYTEFLWLIEGWTAYYDDLLCLRAGVFTRQQYLEEAAKNINGMLAAPGRWRLSLRESSFDAWIRLYRPDENTRNSSQNYYGNGAVAAMCLDLWIRRETAGRRSLDDVLRGLFAATFQRGRGYRLDDVQRALSAVAGERAVEFLCSLVDDALDPPLPQLLESFAIRWQRREADRPYLGVHFEAGSMTVASVVRDSAAFVAGLHPGDEVLAVESLRVDSGRWSELWLACAKVGKPATLVFARRGMLSSCEVVPQASPGTIALEVDAGANAAAAQLLAGWLPEVARTAAAASPPLQALAAPVESKPAV